MRDTARRQHSLSLTRAYIDRKPDSRSRTAWKITITPRLYSCRRDPSPRRRPHSPPHESPVPPHVSLHVQDAGAAGPEHDADDTAVPAEPEAGRRVPGVRARGDGEPDRAAAGDGVQDRGGALHFTFWDRTGPGVPPAELARPNTGAFAVYAAQVGPRVSLDPLTPPGVYLLVHARQAALAVAKVSIRYSWRHREKTYYAEAETHNQLTRGFRSMTETVFQGKTETFLRRLMLLGERHNNQDWKGTVKGMLEAMGKGGIRTAWCSGGERR
ncbi:hypothetical protein SAMD00023353_0400640 [Rosellinia necatrix]|uniref:Uncharacterized protein n=1 Tax=Rosellinia necatrix TaxID=77044 RepID=A0A1S7UIK9_ROSNE|nr:hypothetical protein SAMD00023353_0400640 [Rosellinia necatrix]